MILTFKERETRRFFLTIPSPKELEILIQESLKFYLIRLESLAFHLKK